MSDIEMDQMEQALASAKANYHACPSAENEATLERAKVAIRGARYAVRLGRPPAAPPKVSWVDSPTFVDRLMTGMYVALGVLLCIHLLVRS